MAWQCSGTTNKHLITNLSTLNIIKDERVANAMLKVDRANYVLDPSSAYHDSPQPIGHNVTISAPHMHAFAASHVLPYLHPGARVLDVGSGSAYLSAVFHHLISPTGTVIAIEHVDELAKWSINNLTKDGLGKAIDDGKILILTGDGREGYESGGPYDVIHVGAAAPVTPRKLVEQLASPGRMFIPVGTYSQNILHVDKDKYGIVTETSVMGVSYVPLTDLEEQRTSKWL